MICGSPTIARAIAKRCFCPPDKSLARFFRLSYKSTALSAALIFCARFFRGSRAISSGKLTLSITLSLPWTKKLWKIKPIFLARNSSTRFDFSCKISCPSMITWPCCGRSSPEIACISVDFPEPDLPKIATLAPVGIVKLTFFSAVNWFFFLP